MASSKATSHVPDNSVVERRLRPIYEWLDNGNNKKALQECEKVLKKTSNLQCAKALKALALLRLGKETECCTILDSLTLEKPSDDATLQAMTLCYRELQQLEKICRLYEQAVKIDHTNEELHTHLFMAYVRVSDFKSQQQAAMTLYKLKARNPYYCWVVMSIILQATRGPDSTNPQKRNLLLSLAERMINKFITDNKMEAEQEAQLYIMVLELQQKYEELLSVLEGPIGDRLNNCSISYSKLPYMVKLKQWNKVNLYCKSILVYSVDKWNIWKEYINSVFELMQSPPVVNNHGEPAENGQNDLETVDDTPEKSHEFICRLVENVTTDNGYLLRGPYLARFELCSKLMEKGIDTDLLGDTIELFIEYFRKFGHKPCCVSDLRTYLKLLDGEKKTELGSRLIKDVGISATSIPQSGPSDPYALLAAHVLYDLAQLTQSSEHIILALVLLDNLLNNSPSNFHAKLLSVRLYHTLGGGIGAQTMYESLDVKHLQLDSLGYIHCGRLPTTGLLNLATNLYDTTLKFFSSNYKDSSDHLTFSYKFGSFQKLDEFMDFRERLNNSLHYTTIAVDGIMLCLMQCTTSEALYNLDISPKDNKISWETLRDNHDLSVYQSWDPERALSPPEESEEIKLLFEQDVSFLKLRASIVWAMSAALDIVKSTDGTRNKNVELLKGVLKDWDTLEKDIKTTNYTPIKQNQVTLPLPSRLHGYLEVPYFKILGTLYQFFIHIAVEEVETSNGIVSDMKNTLDDMLNAIENRIESHGKSSDPLWLQRVIMERVVNITEVLSISCLLCLLCHNLMRPSQGKKTKRKSSDLKNRELLNDVVTELKQVSNRFDEILDDWNYQNVISELSDRLLLLNLSADGQTVLNNIRESRVQAVKSLKGILKSKSKFLSGLIV
ncbi:n-terminal acetyltransferase-related [Holotrichia oblita]|uniref:N-terminal acetyltransferase-related n=1 Tax=Holotrichia oblita TaxID=644536 RepID=A0ACB9SJS6_HOLOL|nr:n-terminal acetyltransferase-related [Holotrichia oblita]